MSKGVATWWVAGSALAIVVVLVIVALGREPVQLDPSTPEGTVQLYLQALSDGDYEVAVSLIHQDGSDECGPSDLALAAQTEPFTATLGDTDVTDDTAFVEVLINQGEGPGPFGGGGGGYQEVFVLEDVNDQWLITGDPWPYFTWRCREEPA